MSQPGNERPRVRATVLVASDSKVFLDIISHMVADCGFAPAMPARAEPPDLSVTRTQPALVICDCGGSGDRTHVEPLVVEVFTRGLPLLLATAARDRDVPQLWVLPARVAWLDFPIDRVALRTLIDRLMMPAHMWRRSVALSAGGLALDAGLTTRTLADIATVALPAVARARAEPDGRNGR